ncbi:hypothetical protein DL765_005449 [Monosporascus sp. GIB2]|nr:hypothetical protein DL765_005449 [Monosporascus sp. GIB2]
MSLQPYTYTPLSGNAHTRVIKLQPAKNNSDPLHCTVGEIKLDTGEPYSAISYTWGQPNFTEKLIIDQTYILPITPNLHDALVRFRLREEPRSLWTDAVCINQQDDAEKSKQVASMTDIYRQASSVLVWLGDYRKEAKALKELGQISRRKEFWLRDPPNETLRDEILERLLLLTDLPWFSRRWVIQEVVLNPEPVLFCAAEELHWLRLVTIFGNLGVQRAKKPQSLETMLGLWKARILSPDAPNKTKFTLLDLMDVFEHFDCANPKDKIYALIGISANHDLLRNKVDYSIPTGALYTWLAAAVLDEGHTGLATRLWQAIFARITDQGDNASRVPWWVPDWRLPKLRIPAPNPPYGSDYRPSQYRNTLTGGFRELDMFLRRFRDCQDYDHIMALSGAADVTLKEGAFRYYVTGVWDPFPSSTQAPIVAKWLRESFRGWSEHMNFVEPRYTRGYSFGGAGVFARWASYGRYQSKRAARKADIFLVDETGDS